MLRTSPADHHEPAVQLAQHPHITINRTVDLLVNDLANNTSVVLDDGLLLLGLRMASGISAANAVLNFKLGTETSANTTFATITATTFDGDSSIGTMNVSNGQAFNTGSATFNKNILGLTAGGMNTLNVSDTLGLLFSQIYETYTPPTALTIKNDITSAYGLYIGGNGRDFWSESLTALTINTPARRRRCSAISNPTR